MQNVYIVHNVADKSPRILFSVNSRIRNYRINITISGGLDWAAIDQGWPKQDCSLGFMSSMHALLLRSYNIRRHLRGDVRPTGQGGPDIG